MLVGSTKKCMMDDSMKPTSCVCVSRMFAVCVHECASVSTHMMKGLIKDLIDKHIHSILIDDIT